MQKNHGFTTLSNFNSLFDDFNSMFNFNSFSFSYRKYTPPVTTTKGADVNLGVGLSYTVKNNGLNIHGNTGFEKVTISQNVSGIKIDSAVESVTFKGVNFNSGLLVSSQGSLAINSTSGNLATLNLTANHNESLNFSNAVGTATLDSSGNGIFNLSQIQLDKNQNYAVLNNDLIVYGNSGQEKVTLGHDITGVSVSNMVETVAIDGNFKDYSYDVQGGTVVVSSISNGNDVAFIDVNSGSTGTQIQFADKTLNATWETNGSFGRWSYWNVVVTDPTTPAASTIISGGSNLPYVIDFSQTNLGGYLSDVEAVVKTALDNIGQYVKSTVPFNLQVLTEQTSSRTLAETSASMVTVAGQNGVTQATTFVAEATSGTNSNGSSSDATLYINLANLNKMAFDGTPAANQYDLTSIVTHEILHGLAFTGNLESAGARTAYDSLVTLQNNSPVFTGSHAEALNGNAPILLDSASAGDGSAYYHVVNANDLMADSIGKGEVRTISSLDVAMLQDMGLTIVGTPPTTIA